MVRQLALAAGVALACTSQPAHAGFGTAELVSTTISQIPDCLDYRILGLSLRVIWTPYGPYYFWTLHVGHTVPAMVNQSHPYLDEMPWEDYSRLLGSAYRTASEAIVHVVSLDWPTTSKSVPDATSTTSLASTTHRSTTNRRSSATRR